MGEHELPDTVPGGLPSDLEHERVPAGALGEADRARPARCLGEHQVGAGGPGGEFQEFRCPRDTRAAGLDHVAEGRMGRMRHGLRGNRQPAGGIGAHRGAKIARGGQPTQFADEFGAFIGDQPGS
ncbi:MAG TPA: hypothetical protein VH589_01855 [Trebonia sp.]